MVRTKVALAAVSYEPLNDLFFGGIKLTLVYWNTVHDQLTVSDSSLHDLVINLLRLIAPSGRSRLLSTSVGPGLSATFRESRLGAATASSR